MKIKFSAVKKSGVDFFAATGRLYGVHIDDAECKDDTISLCESFESADDEWSPEYFLSFELDRKMFKKGFFSEEELKTAKQKIFLTIDSDLKIISTSVQGAIGEIKSKWKGGEDVSLALFDADGGIWQQHHDNAFFSYDELIDIRDAFTIKHISMAGYKHKLCVADKSYKNH